MVRARQREVAQAFIDDRRTAIVAARAGGGFGGAENPVGAEPRQGDQSREAHGGVQRGLGTPVEPQPKGVFQVRPFGAEQGSGRSTARPADPAAMLHGQAEPMPHQAVEQGGRDVALRRMLAHRRQHAQPPAGVVQQAQLAQDIGRANTLAGE